ncbi:She2 [Kluyveromyces lactis]|nr:She2 [Kluyveromyces lactis]
MTGCQVAISKEILDAVLQLVSTYSNYISRYVDYLNNLIAVQRRVSTLRFERMTLIKYVKKLRFMADVLHSWSFEGENDLIGKQLNEVIDPLGSYLIKVFEILDLLNFYITQPMRGETISKTLNEDLVVSEETIVCINDSYRIYIKGIQWLVESISERNGKCPHLALELIEFTRKCAIEDEVDFTASEDILLQDVAIVELEEEYVDLLHDWSAILVQKQTEMKELFSEDSKRWASITKPVKK